MADETQPQPSDPLATLFGTLSGLIGLSAARSNTQARNQRYLGLAAIAATLLQNFGILPVYRAPAPSAPVVAGSAYPAQAAPNK